MWRACVLFAIGAAIAGCDRPGETLTVTGSSTIAPLMTELAERYQAETGIQVDVQSGGSGRGISDTRQGLADLGMVSRALKPDEQDLASHLIARDGIAMIVHGNNPIDALTAEQVRAIYTGKVDHWRVLGGPDQAITVVHKADGRSTQALFLQYVGLDNDQVTPDRVIGDNQQGIKAVAGDPYAIGYVSIGTAIYESQAGTPLKLLPLDGVPATLEAVRDERYPLSRQLNLVSRGKPSPRARALIDFVTREDRVPIYHDYYFIPVTR